MSNIYAFQDLILKTQKVRGLKTKEYQSIGKYPIIDQGSDFIAGYTDDESSLYKDSLPVVIFGDHTLALKYVDFPFCAGADGTQILKPNEKIILGKFLYYAIRNLNIKSLGYSRHFKVLKEAKFNVPSLEEQKHIVRELDLADTLRQKRKQVIALLDDYIDAIFFSMFVDNVDRKNIPLIKLEDITTKITDGVHFKPKYVESGVPFISVTNVTTKKLIFNNCKFVSGIDHQGYIKRCKPEFDDILYTKVGATYGRACIVDTEREFSLYVSVALIKPKKDLVTPTYLKHALNSKFIKHQADRSVKGAGVPDLHLIEIKKFNIPLPPIREQDRFSEIVKKIEQLKYAMLAQSDQLETNFNSLTQAVFNRN